MSEDPPRYSLYAYVITDHAEACFQWLSANMTQCTEIRYHSTRQSNSDSQSADGGPYVREDIIVKGFQNDTQRAEYWTLVQAAGTTKRPVCIHYHLELGKLLKLRKKLPRCFASPEIYEYPLQPKEESVITIPEANFYSGEHREAWVSLDGNVMSRMAWENAKFCSKHQSYYDHFGCPICDSGFLALIRFISAALWSELIQPLFRRK
jgi:hypothetical protein